jgi:G protein beta subunit-like protein
MTRVASRVAANPRRRVASTQRVASRARRDGRRRARRRALDAMPTPSVVLATAGYDHTVRFWEATRGVCYRTLQYADSQVNKLEITPDKRYLAAAGNPHVRLFEVNASNPQAVTSYDGHTGNVTAVGFEPHGSWMYTGSEDGTVKIWDLRAGGYQREYESRGAVTSVVLHPNGTELMSADQNGNIRVWDLTANACSCELVPEVGTAVQSLTVAGDGSMVVAGNSKGTCYVWKLQPGSKTTAHFEPLHKLNSHNGYVLKCLISPDCRLLATTSSDKTVKLWNLDGFKLERVLEGHQRWVWDCVFSVDAAYLVTASSDTTARLWDCSTGEAIRVYSGHHKAVTCCALNDSAVGDAAEAEISNE